MKLPFTKHTPLQQCDPETWRRRWQSLVPPESRDVPISFNGNTELAFIQINHYVMMLQDGLLMESSFFDVCEFFQCAGYHVIWLMRCIQDIHSGYLKPHGRDKWIWKRPTTNFGRWTSDNQYASILLQTAQVPDGDLTVCDERILQRVIWAESNDAEQMIPKKTEFQTAEVPATPRQLRQWLDGTPLHQI